MRHLLILSVLILCFSSEAQPPSTFFGRFGGPGIDIGYGVKETYHKQYVTIGSTTSFGAGATDAYLALLDSMGRVEWYKTFGGIMADVGKSIIVSPVDSGFVFAGFTNSFGNGGYDYYIVRTDKDGNLKWQKAYGGLDWDFATDLTFSQDGNIIVCGETYNSRYGKKDGEVLKLNFNTGDLMWDKTYGGSEDDEFLVIRNTSDGYYSLCGNTASFGDLNNDFWFFKINDTGDSIRSMKIGNANRREKCYDFVEDHQNNLVFCGSYDTSFYNSGKNVAYVIKTDINGTFLFDKQETFPGIKDDKFLAVANMKNSDQYCFSRKKDHTGFGVDIQPLLLNIGFVYMAATTYGDTKDDEVFDIATTKDNGFVMIGYSIGHDLVAEEVCIVKVDSNVVIAPSIVGVKEQKPEVTSCYYYQDKVYFKNMSHELFDFQLFNSEGKHVQAGRTKEDFIQIDPELKGDIYFLLIGESLRLKFVKADE